MENKQQQNFTRQGSSKSCLSVDSRKSADVHNNKPWHRNTRRRENNSTTSKNDNQRSGKPSGQAKLRPNVDKRPKARGGGGGGGAIGYGVENSQRIQTEDTDATTSTGLAYDVDDDDGLAIDGFHLEYKLNSFNSPGSKKQNLNHLLNFHYASREYDNSSSNELAPFGRSSSGTTGRHIKYKKHKYNKEQFLQANFQFVIGAVAKPKITASPDTLIDWSLIEQINIYTTEEPQCPICLYPPIAAKLTRCGHAYCWPCILHYLALSDKTWRKCPICYEAIHIGDLKSTAIVQQKQLTVENEITFHLMRRKKGSMFIEKYKSSDSSVECYPEYSDGDDAKRFSKFVIATPNDILDMLEREEKDLLSGEDGECPEFVFIQQALDLLKERRDKLNLLVETLLKEERHFAKTIEEDVKHDNDDGEMMVNESKAAMSTEMETLTSTTSTASQPSTKYYYFYQSTDGQHIYLHPLNVKMLQACYGTLDQAPLVIEAKIIQKEFHSMDEDHRRKFTCLGHLPLTCQFSVVEVQLDPPIVSEAILKLFKNDILERRKERQRRDREEKRREKHINEINERQMGKLLARTANINLSSSHEFPVCGFEEPLLSRSPGSGLSDSVGITTTIAANRNSYSSVANFSSSPKKELWPTLRTHATSPNYSELSVWSSSSTSTGLHSDSKRLTTNLSSDRSSECDSIDEKLLTPLATNLGDVLAEAINQKQANETNTQGKCGGGGNKKSKKNKKMLVFSTGMNFSGK